LDSFSASGNARKRGFQASLANSIIYVAEDLESYTVFVWVDRRLLVTLIAAIGA
jgi:hypothetical protein